MHSSRTRRGTAFTGGRPAEDSEDDGEDAEAAPEQRRVGFRARVSVLEIDGGGASQVPTQWRELCASSCKPMVHLPLVSRLAQTERPVLRKPPQGPPNRQALVRAGAGQRLALPHLAETGRTPVGVGGLEHRSSPSGIGHVTPQTTVSETHGGDSTRSRLLLPRAHNDVLLAQHAKQCGSTPTAAELLSMVCLDEAFELAGAGGTSGEEAGYGDGPAMEDAVGNSWGAGESGGGSREQPAPLLPARPLADTQQQWTRYLKVKSASRPQLTRAPLWCNSGKLESVELRFRELDAEGEWTHHRTQVRRQFREFSDHTLSDMKRRLVGDPRLRQRNDPRVIDKIKHGDIERDRDRVHKIANAMQDCARSRHQLVRMQQLIRTMDEDGGHADNGAGTGYARGGPRRQTATATAETPARARSVRPRVKFVAP